MPYLIRYGDRVSPLRRTGTRAGGLIRERRRTHGLSQAQLALRSGTTQATISRLEHGGVSPSVSTLERLLGVMGEELELSAHRQKGAWDEAHMRETLRQPPAERLERAMSWNRFAGEVARAGREVRRAPR